MKTTLVNNPVVETARKNGSAHAPEGLANCFDSRFARAVKPLVRCGSDGRACLTRVDN
jgi:hypothetical protein